MQIHELLHDLQSHLGADHAVADQMTRILYSTDASNYQVMPLAVTFPRNADDVVAVHETARKYGVPVLPRGGGSALAGQAVGEAIIMDFTRHMRRVRSVNAEARTVDIEPGMILGTLNGQVAPMGLMFGPDPASAERAAIGGIIGNNATGAHSIRYGMTADHVSRLKVVLANGDLVWLDDATAALNQIRSTVGDLVAEHSAQIQARYPKDLAHRRGLRVGQDRPGRRQSQLAALRLGGYAGDGRARRTAPGRIPEGRKTSDWRWFTLTACALRWKRLHAYSSWSRRRSS